ncbi:uracil-xanthine permease family protein [Geomonas paludis]|uniref:Uracil-xanthine permease family protein n=1 Tax=Geomonas paludis TaxID=2740185 RepID=A0ABY4LC71_9BACT|nr:uracil-xanthine permease family protein [Geomonas paludis]UPU35583.1 uracil-xanthine permease family protein [Geomonas paludis]
MSEVKDPVWRQALSGAQILFVAFGALVLVPILTGLNPSMALLGAGMGTIIFQLCTKRQVPIFLGSSFAFIAPIIYSVQTWGLPSTLAGLFAAGWLYLAFSLAIYLRGADFVHRIMPPVVVGPIIMIIGLGLANVAVNMAMGKTGDGKAVLVDYNTALLVAGVSLATTAAVAVRARGIFRLLPVLSGVAVGYVLSIFLGLVDFSKIAAAPWLEVPKFVTPEWNWSAVLFMVPVALAPAIEHVGDVVAIGAVTGKDYTEKPGLHRTMLGDGLAVCAAALVGGPPVTTYAEVTGAVMITRCYNPVIMTWAAGFAVVMAFFGKFNAILQSIPVPVMGGIMMLLFGSIASVGLNTLIHARVDMHRPRNLVIVSLVLVFGIGGLSINVAGQHLHGVSLCGIAAILLNLLLPKGEAAPMGGDAVEEEPEETVA